LPPRRRGLRCAAVRKKRTITGYAHGDSTDPSVLFNLDIGDGTDAGRKVSHVAQRRSANEVVCGRSRALDRIAYSASCLQDT